MKTALKVALLKCLMPKSDRGFTLLELTVVLVIGGILSAIALPTLMSQASKAKQAEAKTYVGSLNHGQQAYFLEHSAFTDDLAALGIGLRTKGTNYRYSIVVEDEGASLAADGSGADLAAVHYAEALGPGLKPYVGMAAVVATSVGDKVIETMICEANQPTEGKAAQPTYSDSTIACAPGTHDLAR